MGDTCNKRSPIKMLANSEFVVLLKQANTDSSKMAEVIGVSEAQLRFVTNTASGMGLIKCGSDRKSTRLNSSHGEQSRMPSSA